MLGGPPASSETPGSHNDGAVATPWAHLEDVVDHAGFGWSQWKGIILASAINFSEAMNVSLMPLLFPLLKKEWDLSNAQVAMVGSSTAVGMLAGAIMLGKSSDYMGRRPALLLGLMLVLLFGVGSPRTFAANAAAAPALSRRYRNVFGQNILGRKHRPILEDFLDQN